MQAPPVVQTVAAETSLGVADVGIWADLDAKVQISRGSVGAARVSIQIDARREQLLLSIDGFPRKIYPLGGPEILLIGEHTVRLRPGDRAELAPLVARAQVDTSAVPTKHDRDDDGIPDALDVLIGAKKTALNADAYTEGYMDMAYPNGDVPRDVGVCTDVVIRAVRNAGIDLQRALHEDIARARAAYPMVKGRGDPKIDQRRVKTLLPYFQRHWKAHSVALDDAADPYRPGDVLFMDTFPSRSGPDHIGIVSDSVGPSGHLLVINNWTVGTVTAEMDLLGSVPVLFRFRIPPR